ncbi:gamma-glutamyl-gamma-aminobutyrate hydrolase family protein [Streptomyces sp. ODS28]|uniref:gamma-glutamyl-gamma-aminobutyrate hydrolase family protein n=1 Tax=Streptomyces sp. ODS28 TaxID=3136688 RepID=UPI0031EBD521
MPTGPSAAEPAPTPPYTPPHTPPYAPPGTPPYTPPYTGARRPLIALPQRYSATTSALRYAAVVTARALAEAVLRAGGEPFMMLPGPPEEAAARLARCDGLLLPGGGDLSPRLYADGTAHRSVYDVDEAQDAFDLALVRSALDAELPVLAVCRGLQVANVALGGTLRQDMGDVGGLAEGGSAKSGPAESGAAEGGSAEGGSVERGVAHRHLVHAVGLEPGSTVARAMGAEKAEVSCFHHQCVDRLGTGLAVTARAADGTPEGLELPSRTGWFTAVQWHPEDTAESHPAQQGLFDALVRAAARVRADAAARPA